MSFDATIHLGDIIALATLGYLFYQRVAETLRRIEGTLQAHEMRLQRIEGRRKARD